MMNKYAIACLGVGFALCVASTAFGQEPLKIGVVNFQEIALGSKAGKVAKVRLEKLAEKFKKEVRTEESKLLARQKELEAAASRLTPAERQERAAALERDDAALQRLIEDKTEELKNAETKSIAELAGKIDRLLKAYGAEKGLTVIIEARRPGILYFDKTLDFSAEIIKRFDRTLK